MDIKTRKRLEKTIMTVFLGDITNISKNQRNLESIQVMSELKPESKELQFVNETLFSKNSSNINLDKDEVKNLTKKLLIMHKTFTKILSTNPDVKPATKTKKNVRFIEMLFGYESGTKELQQMKNWFFIKNWSPKRRNTDSIHEEVNKFQKAHNIEENIMTKLRNRIRSYEVMEGKKMSDLETSEITKKLKFEIKQKRKKEVIKIHKIKLIMKELNEELENIENKIEDFSHLKNCCSNCEHTITDKYKNSKIKEYKRKKKVFLKFLEDYDKILSVLNRKQSNFEADKDPYRPFNEAREFVRSLKLKSKKEWIEYTKTSKMPSDIPINPEDAYSAFKKYASKKEKTKYSTNWVDIYDWVGTPKIKKRPYQATKAFAKRSKIKTQKQWIKLCNSGIIPANIPHNPNLEYPASWKSWYDFLN
jgi:hypothetical protein